MSEPRDEVATKWQPSHRGDQEARIIADRHYNRQKIGAPQFVPPGRCMVLKIPPICFWVTAFPFARYVKHEWAGAWTCTAFRNESNGILLSSELIKDAVALTVQYHIDKQSWNVDPFPSLGMITFVNAAKTARRRGRNNPIGQCFLKAGFIYAGQTKQDNLTALRMPLTTALTLWAEKKGIQPCQQSNR